MSIWKVVGCNTKLCSQKATLTPGKDWAPEDWKSENYNTEHYCPNCIPGLTEIAKEDIRPCGPGDQYCTHIHDESPRCPNLRAEYHLFHCNVHGFGRLKKDAAFCVMRCEECIAEKPIQLENK